MRYSKDSRIDQEVRRRIKSGWKVETGGRHAKLVAPDGRKSAIPGSPSDHRAALNWISQLRRMS